jgi:hypothetical protein
MLADKRNYMPGQKVYGLLKKVLALRYLPFILAVAALVTMLGAVKAGWGPMDDLRHRVKLIAPSHLPERLHDTGMIPENSGKLSTVLSELHSSAHTKADTKRLKDYGVLPWWTRDDYRASNWRPLDSFTHWLDYRLFPNSAAMMHIHNILWFAVAIGVVAILYRQLISPIWAAGLAAFLYLLDDSNYFPAMWIANRCLLLSLVFGVLALIAHHRWRESHSLPAAILGPLCLLGSLLSTEAGIATFAYLFAYALIIDRANWVRRGLSLVPGLVVIILWRIVYSALGHGAYSSGFVIDPVGEPLRFAWAALVRGPILLMAQWSFLPAEMFSFIYWREQINAWEVSAGSLVLIFFIFLPLLRNNRTARFWLAGMVLSAVPICASLPMNRNLLFVAIGAFGLLGQFVWSIQAKEDWLPRNRVWQATAWALLVVLLVIHVVLAGIGRIAQPRIVECVQGRFESTMQVGALPGIENQDLVLVNAPNPFSLFYLPPFKAHHDQPLPRAIRTLAPGFGPFEIERTDAKTLLLKAKTGNLLSYQKRVGPRSVYLYKHFNEVFRDKRFAFGVGDKTVLPRLTIEVIAVDEDGQPSQVSFNFDASLDDPRLRWLQWNWQEWSYEPFDVPPVGQRHEIAGPPR